MLKNNQENELRQQLASLNWLIPQLWNAESAAEVRRLQNSQGLAQITSVEKRAIDHYNATFKQDPKTGQVEVDLLWKGILIHPKVCAKSLRAIPRITTLGTIAAKRLVCRLGATKALRSSICCTKC